MMRQFYQVIKRNIRYEVVSRHFFHDRTNAEAHFKQLTHEINCSVPIQKNEKGSMWALGKDGAAHFEVMNFED